MAGLTEKRRRFVEAYVGEAAGNATQAARIAGYAGNDRTLTSVGSELLTFPDVRQAVDAARREMSKPSIATREERQELLTRFMRGEEPAEAKDRLKATELLGKMHGDFLERVELSGSVETTVRVYVPGNGRDKG